MNLTAKKSLSFLLSVALVLAAVAVPIPVNAAVSEADVTIINNPSPQKDAIFVANLRTGDIVLVVKGGLTAFTSTKSKGTSMRFEIPANILDDAGDPTGGLIDLKVISPSGNETSSINSISYEPALQSVAPSEKNIIVTNYDQSRSGTMPDKVNVAGLRSGDVFYVYSEDPQATGTKPANIGASGVAGSAGTAEAKLKVDLGEAGGNVWVTVKSTGRTESQAVEVGYLGVDSTAGNGIKALCVNNYGSSDKVIVTGVYPSDVVEVYDADTGKLLGSGRVAAKKTDIEIAVKATGGIGLNQSGGFVKIRVTTPGKTPVESGTFEYFGEGKSTPISSGGGVSFVEGNKTVTGDVTIYKYEGRADEVEIKNLRPQDTVTIYTNVQPPQKQSLIRTVRVAQNATSVAFTMSLPLIQAGSDKGSIVMFVTSIGMETSDPTIIQYGLPTKTSPLFNLITDPVQTASDLPGNAGTTAPAVVAVTNTALKNNDEILVTGVEPGDKIFIYQNDQPPTNNTIEKKLNTLNTGTVPANRNIAVIKSEFPTAGSGTVYVSVTKSGQQESERIPVDYPSQNKTNATGITFTATNYAGNSDKLTVSGAEKNAIITVYSGNDPLTYKNTAIKGAYVKIAKTGIDQTMTFPFPALAGGASASGILYVGVQSLGFEESDLVEVSYDPEPVGSFDQSKIFVTAHNNYGNKDYVTLTQEINAGALASTADLPDDPMVIGAGNQYPGHSLAKKQTVISIYASSDLSDNKKIGTLTIDGLYPLYISGGATYINRSVTVKDLGVAGGSVWYTFTYPGKAESQRIEVTYNAEMQTPDSFSSDITVENNINTGNVTDYVFVTCSDVVTLGSIVKVCKANTTLATDVIGKATVTKDMVAAGAAKIGLAGKNMLDPNGGSIYVSVQMLNCSESDKIEVLYDSEIENKTDANLYNVIAIDNEGLNIKDIVFIYGLQPGDIVKLSYKPPGTNAKEVVNKTTVGAKQSTVIFNMYIPNGYGWDGYITVTSPGKAESDPITLNSIKEAGYIAQ